MTTELEKVKDELKKIIAEEVAKLAEALNGPTPVDPYAGYDVLEGYARERYGYISGICDAAEIAGVPFREIQAIKNTAAEKANGTDWYAILDQIKY